MIFDASAALRIETRPHKGRVLKTYVFKCSECPKEIRVGLGKHKSATGKCRSCAIRTVPFRHTFTMLRLVAKHKGLDLEMSFEEYLQFTQEKACHYCDSLIPWEPFSTQSKKYRKSYFLDRKDNSKGYSVDNCVVCCTTCNFIRQDKLTYDEFMLLAPGLREVMRRRSK